MATSLKDALLIWKRKLEKNPDDDYILNVIRKLSKAPITLEILETTHIGRTMRMLSKRDDTVGEKAKAVLNKWRDALANQGSDKNKKIPSFSTKKNDSNGSPNKHISPEKSIHFQNQISCKHEDNLLSPKFAEQQSKKYINGHSLYKYDVKEVNLKNIDYDPHTESSEGYYPECPEHFSIDKCMKIKKPVLLKTNVPSSMKHPLPDEKQPNKDGNCYKKLKSSNHPISEKLFEGKNKNILTKEKNKDISFSLSKEAIKKLHYKNIEKQKFESDVKKTNYKESSESKTAKSKQSKVNIHSSAGFISSDVSFEDCLNFNDVVSEKKSFSSPKKRPFNCSPSKEIPKKNSQKSPQKTVSPDKRLQVSKELHSKKEIQFIVPKPASKLDVADITSTLPEIQPNYIPLPRMPEFCAPKKKEVLSNEEAIRFTSSRREKTAVYSGRKNCSNSGVPTLFEIVLRFLCENIDAIECVGDATYEMMKPVLEKCSPSQLYNLENYNPQFLENTDHLWKIHSQRDYKFLTPVEHETWRELYWRAHDEREKKLKLVTANISALMSKSTQIRQVKLAYCDNGYVKPPRDVARKQAKHGTVAPFNHAMKHNPSSKSAAFTSSSVSSSASKKPKIAPLMAKTLKSLKALRRHK